MTFPWLENVRTFEPAGSLENIRFERYPVPRRYTTAPIKRGDGACNTTANNKSGRTSQSLEKNLLPVEAGKLPVILIC